MPISFFCSLLFALILLFPVNLSAEDRIILKSDKSEYPLTLHLSILEDKESKWTIKDVTSPELSNKFIANKKESPSFGFTDSAYWVRFTIKNNFPEEKMWLLYIDLPILDRIDFYIPEPSGGFTVKKTGRLLPFKERDVIHRNFLFKLTPPSGVEQTYYLRFKTESVMSFPISLWSKDVFDEKDDNEYIILGIYYGIIFVMAFYNLSIFFSLKDKNYLFYIFYITSFGFFQMVMNGIAYQYLWPNLPWWNQRATMLFGSLALLWATKFVRSFLSTSQYTPKLDRALSVLTISGSISAVLSLIFSYSIVVKFFTLLAGFLVPAVMLSGILCWRMKYKPARYFIIAWSSFLAGIFLLVLADFKVLPLNFITRHGMQMGSVIEVVLLSISLADRINILRREKEELYNKLSVREEYFKALIENSSETITLLNGDGIVRFVSSSIERLFGYKPEELVGKNIFEFLHPEDVQRAFARFTQLVENPGTVKSAELRFHHKNGSWRIIEVTGYGLINNPIIKGVIINTRDITEKKALQVETMRAGHLKSIGELAAGVAHEINNPINSIINYADMQLIELKKEKLDKELDMIIDISNRIMKEGIRIANIVRNLLSFAREGKEEEKISCSIHEIVSDTLELTTAHLRKDGIKLEVDVPQELPEIMANYQQIQQVFLNILWNARYALNEKYPERGGNKVLEIRGEEILLNNQKHVRINFYDNGTGIPANIINRIMEPFFTTKPIGDGTGLGLSISHGIISDHGGKFIFESSEGEFTKVTVYLPVSV